MKASPTIAALVRERTGCSWSRAKKLCEDGRVTVGGEKMLDPAARVAADAEIAISEEGTRRRAATVLPPEAIVYFDRDVVVVEKPPGMLSVEDEPGNKDTLVQHLRTLLRRVDKGGSDGPLAVVHRLDRGTSGVMVFARTASAQRALAAEFKSHNLHRAYRALAHGEVHAHKVETHLLPDRGDGLRGSHGHYRRTKDAPPPEARRAVTYVEPIEAREAASLVECRLETGRQHQVRIHMSELGHPLLGEDVYIRDYRGERIAASRVMLHARELAFTHPATGREMSFTREPPEDFARLWERLRRA
jgi:23S rRNA pseudouridine1911/1915/1917 synthase